MRIFLTLLIALLWGIGSWWWYTCKVKGFCGSNTATETTQTKPATATPTTIADAEVSPPPSDTDNDGLSDDIEQTLGLDPNSNDSDQDGLKDAAEVGTNTEQAIDSDGDGIINALDNDDDNDTITTQDELADSNGDGDPADAVDTDNDGTANYLDTDSDGDGVSDADEARLNLNPLVADSDGDGVDDNTEIGENINSPTDSDGDGIIDALDTEDTPTQTKEPAVEKSVAPKASDTPTDESVSPKASDTAPTSETTPLTGEAEPAVDTENQVSVDTVNSNDNTTIDAANIYFPFRSANPQLSEDAKRYFEKVVTVLNSNPELKISLIGHTDNIGSTSANQKLGLERAKIIKQTLVDQGSPENQIETSSQGESNPIASNDNQEGRDKNRRVELLPQ